MIIGAHEFEKNEPQRVVISIDLYIKLEDTISENDSIVDVFDYDYMVHSIRELTSKPVVLQETLCDGIVKKMLDHPLVYGAKVSTEKPDIYENCKGVGVETFRRKDS
jgi:dihydroneopterin aldolase